MYNQKQYEDENNVGASNNFNTNNNNTSKNTKNTKLNEMRSEAKKIKNKENIDSDFIFSDDEEVFKSEDNDNIIPFSSDEEEKDTVSLTDEIYYNQSDGEIISNTNMNKLSKYKGKDLEHLVRKLKKKNEALFVENLQMRKQMLAFRAQSLNQNRLAGNNSSKIYMFYTS